MTAEELLMSDEVEVFQYSNVIEIDGQSRHVNVPIGEDMFGVEGDKNVTLKHFTCPKIVGNNIEIDLSEHNLYANYTLADEKGNPKSEDVIQSPCENIVIGDDNITFDWKISEWVTKEDGYIAFSIVAKKSVDGVLETRWYTTPAVGKVLKTVKEGRYIEQQYPDVIDNLMNRVSDLERILANGGGTGGSITVDDALSETSTNPVQNKVVTAEVRRLSEDIADLKENGTGGTVTAFSIPKVFLDGDTFDDMTADKNEVLMKLRYISDVQNFKAYIKIKWQGSSSIAYPKHNFTIKMYEDEACETKMNKDMGWGEQSKYCLKANWIDHSHARNITGARLWDQVVASRSDYSSLPQELRESPNNGAIDGFPIKVYVNGIYHGLYTWNIPKDEWTFNMDKENPDHCVLCGVLNNNGNMEIANSDQFRAFYGDGSWEVEVGEMNEKNTTSFNALISCVMNDSDEDFKTNIHNHLDVQSAIDYYIFMYSNCGLDSLGKNLIMFTYDGKLWRCSAYDMDCFWGNTPWGSSLVSSDFLCPEQYQETNSLLWQRIVSCFTEEMKERYAELRQSVLSKSNMIVTLEKFTDLISKELYADDLDQYPTIPLPTTNNPKQIRKFMSDRIDYVDTMIPNLGESTGGGDSGGGDSGEEAIPVTALSLSKDSLLFASESTTTPNSEYFENLVNESDWQIGYHGVDNSTENVKSTSNVDFTIEGIVEATNSIILNPNRATIRNIFYYDESESMLLNVFANDSNKIIQIDPIQGTSYRYGFKYAKVQCYTSSEANTIEAVKHTKVAKIKETLWTDVEFSSFKNTTQGLTYGFIPAKVGNVVAWRIVDSTKGSYYNAMETFADNESTTYLKRYQDTRGQFKVNTITDETCAYIGFKCSPEVYNNGGKIQYCIFESEDDLITTISGEYTTENVVATITPTDASNKNVSWSVDNNIVELNTSGLTCIVTAKSKGSATLTCTAEDTTNGTIKDTCSITVS